MFGFNSDFFVNLFSVFPRKSTLLQRFHDKLTSARARSESDQMAIGRAIEQIHALFRHDYPDMATFIALSNREKRTVFDRFRTVTQSLIAHAIEPEGPLIEIGAELHELWLISFAYGDAAFSGDLEHELLYFLKKASFFSLLEKNYQDTLGV